MHDEFKASIQSEPLTPESWASFWENMYQKSLAATNKRLAEGLENFVLIYRNEIYMYEVLMNMITSYTWMLKDVVSWGNTRWPSWAKPSIYIIIQVFIYSTAIATRLCNCYNKQVSFYQNNSRGTQCDWCIIRSHSRIKRPYSCEARRAGQKQLTDQWEHHC